MKGNTIYKALEVNDRFITVSVKNDLENAMLDEEIDRHEKLKLEATLPKHVTIRNEYKNSDGSKASETIQMSHYETRKLNEHHQALIREQRWLATQKETQTFREEKQLIEQSRLYRNEYILNSVRNENVKQREINRIIKEE